MNFDPKWIDFFKLPLKSAFIAALSTSLLLAAQTVGYLDLGAVGPYAKVVLIIGTVVSWTATIVGGADYLTKPIQEQRKLVAVAARRRARKAEREEDIEKHWQVVLARLDHLSEEEIEYAANSLRKGTQTFYADFHCSAVGMLQSKGLVWTTGGQHSTYSYPYSFHDRVWQALQSRRDEFIMKDDEAKKVEEARRKSARLRR